mgnify:CR=1 FL=1
MQIQLNQLKHGPNNVRTVEADNLDKLIASIKSRDMLHNLVVQKNGKGYNVIDGNRRYSALCKIHGATSAELIDCKVIEDNATEIGAMANMLREGMHPLDEAEAINNVLTDGTMDYDSLAANWGQTKKWVMQRVSLSELSDLVKEGFRNKEFGLNVAQLFTRINTVEQDDIYKLCDGRFDHGYIERLIGTKKIMMSDVIIPKNHKLYKDIEIAGDLFSENQYVADVEKFLVIQQSYVDEKAKNLKKTHKDCVVIDCYPQDIKGLLKNLVQVSAYEAKEIDPKDLNVIIQYRPIRGDLWIQKYKSKIEMSQKELDAINTGEIPELGLVDMSNPQRELTNGMYYDYLRSEMFEHSVDLKGTLESSQLHFTLAMLCNQIVPIYSSTRTLPVEHYTSIRFNIQGEDNGYYNDLFEEMSSYCEASKCNTLQFFLRQTTDRLHSFLYKGIVASMDQSETFKSQKDLYNIFLAKDWFQPTEEWLNKYKIVQLRLLANKIKCKLLPHDNKKLVMDKLLVAFKEGACFDPIKFLDEVK